MAKQKRKPAKGKPITSHQLFPAVVALWFGALFGLGSLAVRPSLIENLVLSSRIDLVIPAAAPPLGVTARILMALVLAVVGALVGIALARRLARPKVTNVERKRGAQGLSAKPATVRSRDAHPDAPACKPISVKDDLGGEMADAAAAPLAGRRRALAIEPAEDEFVPHDFAPLPGGSTPIYHTDAASAASEAERPAAEQGTFSPLPAADATAKLDWNAAAPVSIPAAPEAQRQVFQADVSAPAEAMPAPAPVPTPESAAAHADGRQVFGMAQPVPPPEQPRQIFGAAIEGDSVSQEFVRDAGYRTSVFETEQPTPLFNREEGVTQDVPVPVVAEAPVAQVPVQAPAVPSAYEPAPAFAAEPAPVVATAPAIPAPVEPAPAPQSEAPSPGSLGMTDLAARLADSMRRRRVARGAVAAEAAAPAAIEAPAYQEPVAQQPVFEAPAPAAVPQAAFQPEPEAAPSYAAAPPQFAPAAEQPQAFAGSAPVFEPAAVEPAAAPFPQFTAEPAPAPVAQIPEGLPSAMRPLALDAFLEEDAVIDSSLLPPRHIAMPVPPAGSAAVESAAPAPQPAAPAIPAAYEPAPLELGASDELAEDVVAEDKFASLLGISQSKPGFVRIEEPEADPASPEPVVIFPGQTAFAQAPQPAVQPAPFAPQAEDNSVPFRRFDDPAAADYGQPVSAQNAAPAVESGAADQALRAALASLQRMSGAA